MTTISEYAERTYPELSAIDGELPWQWSRFDWEQDFPGSDWAAGRRNLIPHERHSSVADEIPVSQEARDHVTQRQVRFQRSADQIGFSETREQREWRDMRNAFFELEEVLREHHGTRHNRIDNPKALLRLETAYLFASSWRPQP